MGSPISLSQRPLPKISKFIYNIQSVYNLPCWETSLGHQEALTLPLVTGGYFKISKTYKQYTQNTGSNNAIGGIIGLQRGIRSLSVNDVLARDIPKQSKTFQNNPKHIIGMTK